MLMIMYHSNKHQIINIILLGNNNQVIRNKGENNHSILLVRICNNKYRIIILYHLILIRIMLLHHLKSIRLPFLINSSKLIVKLIRWAKKRYLIRRERDRERI